MSLCREKIMSQEYQDYLISDRTTKTKQFLRGDGICIQPIGYGYDTAYISERVIGPVVLDRADYHSIPQCFALLDVNVLQEAGILQLQRYPTLELMGEGIMIGFIDTGIDITNPIFRNLDGSTRLEALWDQTIQTGEPPEGILYGTEYTKESLDFFLLESVDSDIPGEDENGHGTRLAAITCGNGSQGEGFLGAAPEASIAFVKLKPAKDYLKDYYFIQRDALCFQENDIMLAAMYLHRVAQEKELPLVICLALGNNLGSHNGTSPLPFLLAEIGKTSARCIVLGTGNEAGARHHYLGSLDADQEAQVQTQEVEIYIGAGVEGITLEFWSHIPQLYTILLESPSGEKIPRTSLRVAGSSRYEFFLERATVWIDYRILVERTQSELIHIRLKEPSSGIWKVIVEPVNRLHSSYHMWMTGSAFLTGEAYFLQSNPNTTIMEPANVLEALTCSWYDSRTNAIAINSGRGYTRDNRIKPDVVAPGVAIRTVSESGKIVESSGSSMATGITAGAAALLLEWLVYENGEPAINSLQIKNLFIIGSDRSGAMSYPNRESGYGRLNLYQTFDTIRQY